MTEHLRPIKACHACGASYTIDDWQALTSARFLWPIDTRICRCGAELKLDLDALDTIAGALPVDRRKFRTMVEAIRAKNTPPEPAPEPAAEPKHDRMDAPRTNEAAIIRAVLDCLDAIGRILDEQGDATP